MSTFIVGFVCSVVLALVLIVWIAYCMFCRERHKPEHYQYDINDLRIRNIEIAQDKDECGKKEITAGFFYLPSRNKDDETLTYSRPDYPEGPVPHLQPSTDKLIDILNESPVDADIHKNVSFDVPSKQYCSDV